MAGLLTELTNSLTVFNILLACDGILCTTLKGAWIAHNVWLSQLRSVVDQPNGPKPTIAVIRINQFKGKCAEHGAYHVHMISLRGVT